jgi:Zn-dependent membrane protease YugP
MLVLPLLLVLACWLISQWAQGRYARMVLEGSKLTAPGGATGKEMAIEFLQEQGVTDVQVVEHQALVSNYFDPARRRLFLRKEHSQGVTLAAWIIAMHEAAHALQTGENLDALRWRQSCIRMSRYLPTLSLFAIGAAMFFIKMPFRTAFLLFAACLSLIMMMNLGTLAVEKHASKLLREWLEKRFDRQPVLLEKLLEMLSSVTTRELGDLSQSARYFFFSALPGSGKLRPRTEKR